MLLQLVTKHDLAFQFKKISPGFVYISEFNIWTHIMVSERARTSMQCFILQIDQ